MTDPAGHPPQPPAPARVGKAALARLIQDRTALPAHQSTQVVQAVVDGLLMSVRAGKAVHLPGIGTFTPRPTAPRPDTIRMKLNFKASRSLQEDLP